ncbi:hypothetical protein MCEMRE196_01366 [Candidatus Nanopelagicaceae bacterium]
MEKSWTLLGHYDPKAKNSFFGMALSVFVAAETFGSHNHKYKYWMCILILASAVFIAKKALSSKSLVGIFTVLISLIWIVPIFDANFFYSLDLAFMLAHSVLALSVAVGAFSYLKN